MIVVFPDRGVLVELVPSFKHSVTDVCAVVCKALPNLIDVLSGLRPNYLCTFHLDRLG